MEQTSTVEHAERTPVEVAAIFCDAIKNVLEVIAEHTEKQEGLPAMQRAMLVLGLQDLAGMFETARGDLLRESERG